MRALCPSGTTIVAGGASIDGATRVALTTSAPDGDDAWVAEAAAIGTTTGPWTHRGHRGLRAGRLMSRAAARLAAAAAALALLAGAGGALGAGRGRPEVIVAAGTSRPAPTARSGSSPSASGA